MRTLLFTLALWMVIITVAGLTDIYIAIAALALAYFMSWHQISPSGRIPLAIWNTLGLLDLISAVGTALYSALTQDGSMDTIARLPFLIVPTMIVPWLFAIHIYIFYRLAFRNTKSEGNLKSKIACAPCG